jgi:Big-like domain-containing protein
MPMRRFLARATASLAVAGLSLFVGVAIAAAAPTSTVLTASPDASTRGQPVTLTATVSGTGTPTGSVAYFDGTIGIGSALLVNGIASFTTTTLATGTRSITANYISDNTMLFDNSSSPPVAVTVAKATTTTTLTISPNPVAPGDLLTVDASVDVTPPGAVDPAGTLQFSVEGFAVGDPLPLGNGTFGWEVTLLAPSAPGTYSVGASYSGDVDTEPSFDSVQLTISAPPSSSPPAAPPAPPTSPAAQPLSTTPAVPAALSASRLNAMTSPLLSALRARGLAALASTVQTLTAPGPGVLDQKVYSPSAPTTARTAATKKSALIASASHRFAAAGKGSLRLKLTAAGRKASRAGKSTKIAIVTRFKPSSGKAVVTTRRLTVKASRH